MLTNYSALDLLAWHEEGALVLSPKFQRRPVWKPAAKSFFIDSMLRGFPVPPVHIRTGDISSGRQRREVIDGQQRLRAVFDFFKGEYRLSKNLEAEWAGKSFSELSNDQQSSLKLYAFHVYQYQLVSDALVLQMFARLNTYSVSLNKQELRNGKYFGQFKSSVYSLSVDYLDIWKKLGVFTDASIARMNEAELVSELLILQLDGMQDKKKSIDTFYAQLDAEWGETARTWPETRRKPTNDDSPALPVPWEWLSRSTSEQRFRLVFSSIVSHFGQDVATTAFRRVPLFYTLYAVIYHLMYRLPKYVDLSDPLSRRQPIALNEDMSLRIRQAMLELNEALNATVEDRDRLSWADQAFVTAALQQTDNLKPRVARLEAFLERIGLS